MNSYLAFYYVHVTCVVLSGSFFVLRGVWMWQASDRLQLRFVRVAPHAIDTLLLGAAVGLAVLTHQYPITHPWLTAKLLALLAYIGLGVFALRLGKTRTQRGLYFVAAVLAFAYMVSVALTRNPLGVFVLG
jgi:uncharacterized membrane protein SirB2